MTRQLTAANPSRHQRLAKRVTNSMIPIRPGLMDETKIWEGLFNSIFGLFGRGSSWALGKVSWKKQPLSDAELKAKVQILFIDDEQFEYIDRIRNAGWNVQQMRDITNLDDERLQRAHIIFLDYKGVGQELSPAQEGIGLLKAIQNKYPSKIVIFYSAHAGFSLGDEFDSADDWLLKHSDPYVYLQKIEEHAHKLNLQ